MPFCSEKAPSDERIDVVNGGIEFVDIGSAGLSRIGFAAALAADNRRTRADKFSCVYAIFDGFGSDDAHERGFSVNNGAEQSHAILKPVTDEVAIRQHILSLRHIQACCADNDAVCCLAACRKDTGYFRLRDASFELLDLFFKRVFRLIQFFNAPQHVIRITVEETRRIGDNAPFLGIEDLSVHL